MKEGKNVQSRRIKAVKAVSLLECIVTSERAVKVGGRAKKGGGGEARGMLTNLQKLY